MSITTIRYNMTIAIHGKKMRKVLHHYGYALFGKFKKPLVDNQLKII
jgi:hypothetical protein